jgi:hypothetical protein
VTFPTDQEHHDAVFAALVATDARPYDYGMTVSDANYNLVTVSPRFGGELRVGGVGGTRAVRVTVLSVGKTAENVNEMRRRADLALREQTLTVAGFPSSPIQFETGDPVGPDGDLAGAGAWFSAITSWTYAV